VLTNDQYLSILKTTSKKKLVDVLQEHLRVPLLPRALLSFDESYFAQMMKGDAIISHPAFVQKTSGPAGSLSFRSRLRNPMLIESGVMNFELDASIDALGRLVAVLLQYITLIERAFVVKGALATRKGLWMVTLNQKHVITVEEMPWNANGSAARLSEFFQQVLDQLLRDMKLRLSDGPGCLLGSGRLGSVFKVCADDGRSAEACMALKVVAGSENVCKLETEFEKNQAICRRPLGPSVIVKAIKLICYHDDQKDTVGAGMLMEEVGVPVSMTEQGGLLKALRTLLELHRAECAHGSARIDNLLVCGDRFKWCDLQRATLREDLASRDPSMRFLTFFPMQDMFEVDLTALLESFDRWPTLPTTSDLQSSASRAYANSPTMEGLLAYAASLGFDLERDVEEDEDSEGATQALKTSPSCGELASRDGGAGP
jgi:hypothetical protein